MYGYCIHLLKKCVEKNRFFDTGDGTNVKLHFVDLEHIEDNIKELLKKVD